MRRLVLNPFKGLMKRVDKRQIPQGYAQIADNCWFGRDDLRAVEQPKFIADLAKTGVQAIYRFGRSLVSDTQHWFHWTVPVDVAKGQIAGDTDEATFWTGDGVMKYTTAALGTAGGNLPSTARPVALPGPVTAPTAAPVTGTGTGTTTTKRQYAYTFISDIGFMTRESMPSPLREVDVVTDQHVALSGLEVVPSNSEPITGRRIYRAEAGALLFVDEINATTSTYTDTLKAADMVGRSECPSVTWTPPVDDLANLVNLPNGLMAGSSGYDVWICEAYRPYAWPHGYALDYPVVALVPFAQSLAALTTGTPYVLTGTDGSAMSQEQTKFLQPCVAKRSAVAAGDDVLYASNQGLCRIGSSGTGILTAALFTDTDWAALRPATIIGAWHDGRYVGSYDPGTGRRGFIFDPAASTWSDLPTFNATAFYSDPVTGKLFCCINDEIWEFRGAATRYALKYRGACQPGALRSFVAGRVVAAAYPITLRVRADEVVVDTIAVPDPEPFKIEVADGYDWEIEVETTNGVVLAVMLGASMEALADGGE